MNCPTENTRVKIFGAALNFDGEVSYTPRSTEAVGTRKSWYIYLMRKKSKSTWARMWDMVWSFQASSCLRCKRSRLVSWSPSPFVTSAVHLDQDFQIPPYLKQWKYSLEWNYNFQTFFMGVRLIKTRIWNNLDSKVVRAFSFIINSAWVSTLIYTLLTFKTEFDVDWYFYAEGLICLECVYPSQDWTLVIGRPATVKFTVNSGQDERLVVPTAKW